MYWLNISQLFWTTSNKTIMRLTNDSSIIFDFSRALKAWGKKYLLILQLAAWKTCQRYTRLLIWIIRMCCLFGVRRGTVQRILISNVEDVICRAFNAWWYTREWKVTYKHSSDSLSNIRVLPKDGFFQAYCFLKWCSANTQWSLQKWKETCKRLEKDRI